MGGGAIERGCWVHETLDPDPFLMAGPEQHRQTESVIGVRVGGGHETNPPAAGDLQKSIECLLALGAPVDDTAGAIGKLHQAGVSESFADPEDVEVELTSRVVGWSR